jgi:hypothetical protein
MKRARGTAPRSGRPKCLSAGLAAREQAPLMIWSTFEAVERAAYEQRVGERRHEIK